MKQSQQVLKCLDCVLPNPLCWWRKWNSLGRGWLQLTLLLCLGEWCAFAQLSLYHFFSWTLHGCLTFVWRNWTNSEGSTWWLLLEPVVDSVSLKEGPDTKRHHLTHWSNGMLNCARGKFWKDQVLGILCQAGIQEPYWGPQPTFLQFHLNGSTMLRTTLCTYCRNILTLFHQELHYSLLLLELR